MEQQTNRRSYRMYNDTFVNFKNPYTVYAKEMRSGDRVYIKKSRSAVSNNLTRKKDSNSKKQDKTLSSLFLSSITWLTAPKTSSSLIGSNKFFEVR